jgi:Dyp-type peroxidase family
VAGRFEGVEHFGYVDGRSQPLFLAEDVEREARSTWDPAFPPAQFLVKDPGDDQPTSFGSFFVFRKLEQDVKGFHAQEEALAAALGLAGGPFEERAGALLVGRFEDGTPVALDPLPADMPPVNDFDFRGDEQGSRCPFVAHVRKTNPRGESPFHLAKDLGFASTVRQERGHLMARRGITYGARAYDEATNDFTDEPSGGVGLLFMAYMASLEDQFEFTQATWANNPNFVTGGVGVDPVIGQGPGEPVAVKDGWGGNQAQFDFGRFVTLKGGEYFFAPSLEFLRNA